MTGTRNITRDSLLIPFRQSFILTNQ